MELTSVGGGRDAFLWGTLATGLALVLNNLLVGFNEELVYRGILFEAFRTRLRPLHTVLITSLLFGLLHLSNVFGTGDVVGTVIQVVSAALTGVMFGMLRLRVGSIVPVMLLHGLIDITSDDQGVAALGAVGGSGLFSDLTGLFINFAPPFYGVFLYWNYRKAVKAGKISETPNLLKDQPRVADAV